uniref:Progonadoliberin n=1 Tax=Denticeps clupeoides TaxID=299321 RepID=A0AAY4ECD6_9TELE
RISERNRTVMVCVCRLVLLVAAVLLMGAQFAHSQHWSHGWYPGGKREIDLSPNILEQIKMCVKNYPIPQKRNILKNIYLDTLAREFHRIK